MVFKDEEWLVYLEDGRFGASLGGIRLLTYYDPEAKKAYTAEELRHHFYKPDEVWGVIRERLE